MRTVLLLVTTVVVGSIGMAIITSGHHQPGGHLRHVVADIGRPPASRHLSTSRGSRIRRRGLAVLVRRMHPGRLRLLEIDAEHLVVRLLALGSLAGVMAGALTSAATIAGSLPPWSPVAATLGTAVVVPVVHHVALMSRADAIRVELRHQLASFLDVVTIILAGNIGHEGALRIAAESGGGRLFSILRQRIREATTAGRSAIDALYAVGEDLGLDELGHVAATIELASTEGSPVVRTLSATCATLRSTLAAEHEVDARLRTSRLTAPLIGMALIFMGLVVYPAVHL